MTPDRVCNGFDVPPQWTKDAIAFWTATKRYQPWKDVASFFKNTYPADLCLVTVKGDPNV